MNDLLLLVASIWISQGEFRKMRDQLEKGKDTKGQDYDQDLKQYSKEVEQINGRVAIGLME